LTRIESEAFSSSSLQSILIPRTVQILGSNCFSDCSSFSSISFESPSQFKRIESRAFPLLNDEIVIPSTILFVASDAIPNSIQIKLEDCDSCLEFNRWLELRKKHIEIDFRLLLKFDSDLGPLKSYLVDISLFEEESAEGGIGQVLSKIYRRQDDGCLIVVKLISFSVSVDNREIERAIEKEVNILHPCIAAPIGFVFPAESSALRELKIVRLFVEGCSLSEVLLTNPVWWTPTMKAKVVAGIALGLRFAHNFGLIHSNLNSNTILFDESHQIQIINFGHMDLEVHEGECATGCDVFGEEWTAQVDLHAFGSLLLEITIGQTLIVPGDVDSEGTVTKEVPKLVLEIIERIQSEDDDRINSFNSIIDILKKNWFKIEAGVNSQEILKFVHRFELLEQS
jgi:hypothetical protein